jgi:hypothetical protein
MSKSEQTYVSFRGDDGQRLIVTLVNLGADCPHAAPDLKKRLIPNKSLGIALLAPDCEGCGVLSIANTAWAVFSTIRRNPP